MAMLAKNNWTAIGLPPDLVAVGDGPSLVMHELSCGGYGIVSLLPPCEQRMLVGALTGLSKNGSPTGFSLRIANDFPTTSVLLAQNFVRDLSLNNKIPYEAMEPHDAVQEIIEQPHLGIAYPLWSPHWQFLEILGLGHKVSQGSAPQSEEHHWYDTFLLADENFKNDGRLFHMRGLIWRAWLRLRENDSDLNSAVSEMLFDANFKYTLGVWSRHLMVRIQAEAFRLDCPAFADVFVGREAAQGSLDGGRNCMR